MGSETANCRECVNFVKFNLFWRPGTGGAARVDPDAVWQPQALGWDRLAAGGPQQKKLGILKRKFGHFST